MRTRRYAARSTGTVIWRVGPQGLPEGGRRRYEEAMGKAAVITWNLHGRPRSEIAAEEVEDDVEPEEQDVSPATPERMAGRVATCIGWLNRHLAAADIDRAVVVFQEVPDKFGVLLASATGGAWSVAGSAGHHVAVATMGPLTVSNVEALAATDSGTGDRALRVDVDGLLPARVRIVGLHWLDRRNYPPGSERDSLGRPFWANIRLQWEYPERPHFLVLGDFNENPYDHALVSRRCLWAIRDRADLDGRARHFDQRPPLYNPMWRLLPERVSPAHGPHGTHHWYRPGVSGVRWFHIDQILVSPSVVDLLESVDVLVELDGQRLVSRRGVPDVRAVSDHLPVIAILGA